MLGDVNRFAMIGQVFPLAIREALRQPRHWRFGEPKLLPGMLAKPKAAEVILRKTGRDTNVAAVLKRNEASIEEQIGVGRQQEPIGPIESLGCCLARPPRPDMAGNQQGGILDAGESA